MADDVANDAAAAASSSDPLPYDRWTLRNPSKVPYGYFSGSNNRCDESFWTSSSSSPPPSSSRPSTTTSSKTEKGFYITTAINYTNGPAHMGHAYEGTTADVIARFARLNHRGGSSSSIGGSEDEADDVDAKGESGDVGTRPYFVTGADEHGEKIAKTAEGEGRAPIDVCNKYVTGFQCLNQRILISNDDYIRTTSTRHKCTAQSLWLRCAANDDIYLDQYTGWYNVKEETFVTDSEAELCDYRDPSTGRPLKRVQEASYFFKMSNYHDELVEFIEGNINFIRPESHRNAILARLRGDKLRDLSISRTTFDHGVPVPVGFEDNHVMYVWFDALANYLTGVDALGVNNNIYDYEDDEKDVNDINCGDGSNGENNAATTTSSPSSSSSLASLWPADVHIIGKDILWFHAVIWPCILMSAKLPLPKTIFAHGFVNDSEGRKMSKSVGNVVDPHDMLDIFDVDSFRWYLCREAPYGGELSFSEASMRDMHNADLVKTLGNLVQRVTKLCEKYCGGVIPDVDPGPSDCVIDFEKVRTDYVTEMTSYALESGANIAIQACRDVNGYLTREEPWKLVGDVYADKRRAVVRATLEAVYAVTHLLLPFIPKGASEIFSKMNTSPRSLWDVDSNLRNNLLIGTKIDVGGILYEINKSEAEKELSKAEASSKKKESYEEAQRLKKEKRAREVAASKARLDGDAGGAGDDQPEFTKIDIRVGQITKVWNHPEADKLFCEEIDVGEESGPRQIASGLREHYTLEEMQNQKVLVVCNLKAAKIVGFTSNGMVLAAKSTDGKRVELISPPANALIGERVYINGLCGEPLSSAQVKKKKIWESVAKDLITGENGVATWDGKEILTSAGACSAISLVGTPIS